MTTTTPRHRILREVIRNYTTFEDWCRQTGQYSLSRGDVTINFSDLKGCLNGLSPRKKEAVFFHVIYDWKQKDVAAQMGITTVSVGQYVEQAMIQAAKLLWPELSDAEIKAIAKAAADETQHELEEEE